MGGSVSVPVIPSINCDGYWTDTCADICTKGYVITRLPFNQGTPCPNPLSNSSVCNNVPCNDNNPYTVDDKCNQHGTCAGVNLCIGVNCSTTEQCRMAGVCDYNTGLCTADTISPQGTPCSNPNSSMDICDTNGNCTQCSGIIDCNGICNGGLVNDICGVCGGDGTSCLGCDGVPNSGLTNDICGVCGGLATNCNECFTPCTSECETSSERIFLNSGITQCQATDCYPGEGECPQACEGKWGVCNNDSCVENVCDSNCKQEYYYISPEPPIGEYETCEYSEGELRYCESETATHCPPPADCTYESTMSECYDCNFDNDGNFIDNYPNNNGIKRKEYRIITPSYGNNLCMNDTLNIELEDKDPHITVGDDGSYNLTLVNQCLEQNPSCISCKSMNQIFQDENVSSLNELCNKVYIDIRRLKCTPDGLTSDNYNINNMDILKKFTNINKGSDENYDIFEKDRFDTQYYRLKNKPKECFHNLFNGSNTLCEDIFIPDNTIGNFKYIHDLDECIDSQVDDWSNILRRSDPLLNNGDWFETNKNEIDDLSFDNP